jgi:CRISPR-associated protein Cas6/Cse3/CasE subtype I-E
MYLTELDDPIGDDYAAHKFLSGLFHDQRILFQRRVRRVSVLSRKPADGGISRDITPILASAKPGDEFLFVVRLNPVVTKFLDGKNRRVPVEPQKIRAWLESAFSKNGFTAEFTFRVEGMRRSVKGNGSISLFSVLVNGVLVVTDPGLFRNAVEKGIGHGKGLGFGLPNIFDFV